MTIEHEQRNPIETLAEEFILRRRNGEHPSVEQYAQAHPELTEEINRLFPAVLAMERVKSMVVDPNHRPIELRVDKLEKLGDYRILREIGRGGMGIVYEAEQQSLGRLVAVKVFPRQSLGDSRQLQRFKREARVAALLHHTNIVQVFGVGEQDGLSYYVMQLIRGVSLDRVIDQLGNPDTNKPIADRPACEDDEVGKKPVLFTAAAAAHAILGGGFQAWSAPEGQSTCATSLHASRKPSVVGGDTSWQFIPSEDVQTQKHVSPGQGLASALVPPHRDYWRSVAQIGVQVGEALKYAHAHGTLHRDIKPSNLLLDPKGTVWVTDFGVAKTVTQEKISRPGDVVGTLRYMPPEQLRGNGDARSDIYSLGLTLYELATFSPAFGETSEDSLVNWKLEKDPLPPRKRQPGVPRDLETIVLKAIARDPGRRYQTASELVNDLARFLDGRPIRARRIGPAERLWRWSRRNPAIASLSTLLLLVILTAFATVSWKWHEAESEKTRTQTENHRAELNLSVALDSMDRFLDRFESTWMAHPLTPQDEDSDGDFHVPVSDRSAAILEDALIFYNQFARQNADNPRLQLDTANAHRRVGEIYERLGEHGKAKDAFSRAIEIYNAHATRLDRDSDLATKVAHTLNQLGRVEKFMACFENAETHFNEARQILIERADHSPQCRYELAHTLSNLGSVSWHQKLLAEAAQHDRDAIQLLERLVAEHPDMAEYRLALAHAYRHHHPVPTEDNPERGQAWYRKEAVSIIEALAKQFPQVPDYQCELCETLAATSLKSSGFAGGAFHFGGRSKQMAQLRQAVELAKSLAREYPEIPRYRGTLARCQKDLAWLLQLTHRPRMAEPLIAEAVTRYERLWEDFPEVGAYRFFLAGALHFHGNVLRDVDRLADSRQALERAVELQQAYVAAKPDRVFGKSMLAHQNDSLARTLKLLGDEDEADKATRRAKEIRETLKGQFKRQHPSGDSKSANKLLRQSSTTSRQT